MVLDASLEGFLKATYVTCFQSLTPLTWRAWGFTHSLTLFIFHS